MELNRESTACFTGHRMIASEKRHAVETSAERVARALVMRGYDTFLCGGALGFDTLAQQAVLRLRQELPEAELWLIMGADMFLKLESWKEARRIFAACSVAALCREKIDDGITLQRHAEELNRRYGADCRVLRHQVYEVSSTSVRDGDPATDGRLPEKVLDYIRERGLYGVR